MEAKEVEKVVGTVDGTQVVVGIEGTASSNVQHASNLSQYLNYRVRINRRSFFSLIVTTYLPRVGRQNERALVT